MIRVLEVCYFELDELHSVVVWCTEGDWEHHGSNWKRSVPWDDAVEGCFAWFQFLGYAKSHLGDCTHEDEV